jgi:hypothetical protein
MRDLRGVVFGVGWEGGAEAVPEAVAEAAELEEAEGNDDVDEGKLEPEADDTEDEAETEALAKIFDGPAAAAADAAGPKLNRFATPAAVPISLRGVRDFDRSRPGVSGDAAKGLRFLPLLSFSLLFCAEAAVGRMNDGVLDFVGVLRPGVEALERLRESSGTASMRAGSRTG